jgi:dTDP-4-amino-4,6-dideoxygalactose transaminase/nucleoside-diphosphate-sugar epimerase
MKKDAKIFIAGHNGMVGSAIKRMLESKGFLKIISRTRQELDLTNQKQTEDFFLDEKPEYVFLAAGKVGGIRANINYPKDFIYDNLQITTNIIHSAYKSNVKKLLFIGSSCIYPKNSPQPIKEEYLLTGCFEPTNEPLAIAKVTGIKLCQAYNQQHGCNFISVIPSNMFGINDDFDIKNSHLIAALITKIHNAKLNNNSELKLWGGENNFREFLYVEDFAKACIFLMENHNSPETINIGTGKDLTIRTIAEIIKKKIGFNGNILFDSNKPSGMYRKLLDVSKINSLGWKYETDFEEGIKKTYDWYLENLNNLKQKGIIRKVNIGNFVMSEKEKNAINEVCESGRITENEKTKKFEEIWASKIGTKHAIALNSGTSALISGLFALKHLASDEKRKKVITTPLTYIATSNAIRLAGLEPVYGDVDNETFTLLPSEIERILKTQNPEEFLAILPVHLMGYPCNMDEINRIAKEHNLFVFEDAAQAHGTKYNGKNVGSLGDLSDFSFYIAHNIQAGELGAINTNNYEIKKLIKRIKSNGRLCSCDICNRTEGRCPEPNYSNKEDFDPRFAHDILGFNFRTNEFTTAIASEKINQMEEIDKKRRENIYYLNNHLSKFNNILQLPKYSEDISYLGYPLILKKGQRKKIRQELEKRGIETRILFGCIPFHQDSFSDLKELYSNKLPNAKFLGENGFYIGCHQYLVREDLDHIIKCFNEIFEDLNLLN